MADVEIDDSLYRYFSNFVDWLSFQLNPCHAE